MSQSRIIYGISLIVILSLLVLMPLLGRSDCDTNLSKTSKRIYFEILKWKPPEGSPSFPTGIVPDKEIISLACDNGFLNRDLISKKHIFQCQNGKFNNTLLYEDLLCRTDLHKNDIVETIYPSTSVDSLLTCNHSNWELLQVSLEKQVGDRKAVYAVCLNKQVMRPKFTIHQIRTESSVNSRSKPLIKDWGFDGLSISTREKNALSKGYVQKIQKRRMTNYFNKGKKYPYIFNRGHLVPLGDFSDLDEKAATVQYVNAAPQWSDLNGNSWSLIEQDVREMVQNSRSDWVIYTGTYGNIATQKGNLTLSPVFNQQGQFQKAFLPVPMLYWKIVHNIKNEDKSRVFLGVNNPEFRLPENISPTYLICQPVINPEGKHFSGNEHMGFTFECEFNEFLNKLKADENI